jgi:hypothetical protein
MSHLVKPTDVICPRCHAERGEPCNHSHTFHQERLEAASLACERIAHHEPGEESHTKRTGARNVPD